MRNKQRAVISKKYEMWYWGEIPKTMIIKNHHKEINRRERHINKYKDIKNANYSNRLG